MPNDWDARPRSTQGDESTADIFHAVGLGLTLWETLESGLAELLDVMIASKNRSGFKLYRSGKSVNARMEMLRAVLPLDNFDEATNVRLESFVQSVEAFSARRNEMAHGRAFELGEHGVYLCPNNTNPTKWGKSGAAKFQYVAADLLHYAEHFSRLVEQARSLKEVLKGSQTQPY